LERIEAEGDSVESSTFKAADANGNTFEIICTRTHIGETNKWCVWHCKTDEDYHASPVQGKPDQFKIVELNELVVTSLKPNLLK
jgi:hypothetical protein